MTIDTTTEAASVGEVDSFTSRIADACPDTVSIEDQLWVARTPLSLDVMGGIAEYTGALTLSATTGGAVLTAVQKRQDQNVLVHVLDTGGNGQDAQVLWPLSRLYDDQTQGKLIQPATFRERFADLQPPWAGSAARVLYAMLHGGLIDNLGGGLALVYRSTLPPGARAGTQAAVETGTVVAVAAAFGVQIDGPTVAGLARHAQRHSGGVRSRVSAAACGLLGCPRALLQVRCQPHDVLGSIPLPSGISVIGIDCGYTHPKAEQKNRDVRAATLMGRTFVDRTIRTTGAASAVWDGHLARITAREYVERFRDRIPTKMKGNAFLERFGQFDDPSAQVDPSAIYKIRSRTEHHIYENDRAHQFVERLSRAARTGERTPLIEAGELMYASHWSYGQRCGLGTVPTDLLVNLLRKTGCPAGIYGARIAGDGARGMVVVLIGDTDNAHDAVKQAVDTYQHRTGNQAVILRGSSPGAMVTGVRRNP